MNLKKNSIKNVFIISFLVMMLSMIVPIVGYLKNDGEDNKFETANLSEEIVESNLSLGWNSTRVQTISKTTTNGLEYDEYWEVPDDLQIVGGMTIRLLNKKVEFVNGTTTYTANIVTPKGYRVSKVFVGNEENKKLLESDYRYASEYSENRNGVLNYFNSTLQEGSIIIEKTPEELDPDYCGTLYFKVEFKPVTYKLTMYYDSNLTDYIDDLGSTAVVDFTIADGYNLSALSNKTSNKEFGAWVLKVSADELLGSLEFVSDNGAIVTVRCAGGRWAFAYSKKFDGTQTFETGDDDITYYYITTVQGYGNFNESVTGDKHVFAKWTNIYDVNIDNSSNNWSGNTDLAGAYSNNDPTNKSCIAKIKIKEDTTNSKDQKFFSNVGSAFTARKTGLQAPTAVNAYGVKYYVYNYGYEISGWKIQCSNGYYLKYDATEQKWELKLVECTNLIGDLGTTGSGEVASYLDNVAKYIDIGFINGCPPDGFKITMKPIWGTKGVNIQVRYDGEYITDKNATGSTDSPIVYRSNKAYDLERVDVEQGKSLMYYLSKNKDTIALSGKWNYTNLSQTAFDTKSSKGIYILDVTTGGAVDNIYKINLIGVKTVSTNTYKITNNGYEFSESKAYETLPDLGFYTFENYPECEFKTYADSKKTNIEDYINDVLVKFYKKYVDGIKGDFNILRKVFATSGSLDAADTTNKTFISTSPNFYIFLANGQQTGELPTIDAMSSELVLWEWDETADNNIAFKNSNYIELEHNSEMIGLRETESYSKNKVWNLSDTWTNKTAYDINFVAHYFSKYYYLDIETLLDSKEGKFGYVLLDVRGGESGSGQYLAIFDVDNKDVLVYKLDKQVNPLSNFALCDDVAKSLMKDKVKIYVGCTLTIYVKDQSQDAKSMESGDYDDMIGYRFKELTSQDEKNNMGCLFDVCNEYKKEIESSVINGLSLESGSTIKIQAHFEKIKYSLTVLIDDLSAGLLTVTRNGESTTGSELTIENLEIGEKIQIEYNANVGYEFRSNAFVLTLKSGTEKVLIKYGNLIKEGKIEQSHEISLNATWLRENYYSEYTDYSRDDTYIGKVCINTQGIPFNYGIKLYDSTSTETDDKIIFEYTKIKDSDINALYMVNGTITLPSIGEELSELFEGSKIWTIKVSEEDYALLNSRLYFRSTPLTTEENYFTEYDFLLKEKPTKEFVIDSGLLSKMCDCRSGDIVPFSSRSIYTLLEVREFLSITMKVYADKTGFDTNSTARTTTISNGNENSVDIITEHGTVLEDKWYSIKDSETVYDVVVYTYNGLINNISSTFDEKRYSGVQYFKGAETTAMLENSFMISSDTSIAIKYIPKSLRLTWKFKVDGEDKEKTDSEVLEDGVLDLIEDLSSPISKEYKINDAIRFVYEILNSDYEARIDINGASRESIRDGEYYSLSSVYVVKDSDYDAEGINVNVYLKKKPKSDITIRYVLNDESKSVAGDDYGTLSVMIGNETGNVGDKFTVIEGKYVKVDISNLKAGYEFSGKIQHNKIEKDYVMDGSVITLTNSYIAGDVNNEGDSGEYLIFIDKVDVSATLNSGSYLSNWTEYYQIKDESKTSTPVNETPSKLTNLYVGKEITLWHKEVDNERLINFYYMNAGERVNVEKTLKITSDLLELFKDGENFNIQINFEVKKRYQIIVEITEGEKYVSSWNLVNADDDETIESGTYIDEGNEIKLTLDTLIEGKYRILVSHNVSGVDLQESYEKLDLKYTMNQDIAITIKVQEVAFAIVVSENIYSSLEELNGTPHEVKTEDWVNGIGVKNSVYESNVTLNIVRVITDDRRLQTITIFGNDMDGVIKIEFNDANFNIYYKKTDDSEFEKISSEKLTTDLGFKLVNRDVDGKKCVSLSYVAKNEINIKCDYIDFKIITAE